MTITARLLGTHSTTHNGVTTPDESQYAIAVSPRLSQFVIVKASRADGAITLFYRKTGKLSDTLDANPAGPDGTTLRAMIASAIETAGGARPVRFVRY